jgi:hypothetical protein
MRKASMIAPYLDVITVARHKHRAVSLAVQGDNSSACVSMRRRFDMA